MNDLFGFTRNVVKKSYALLTPSGFVPSFLPGWSNAVCVVQISPAMGANFCQFLITLNSDGEGQIKSDKTEYFIFVIEGKGTLLLDDEKHKMEIGSYAFIPPQKELHFKATRAGTRLLIFQKEFETLPDGEAPEAIVGQEKKVKGNPFLGNEDACLQVLLPDKPVFDMAVNIFTYQPGATLPFVETHIMEHGLVMLSGQGVYRLDADYHPVQAGDVIWMAPYCPQWFVAMGKTSASYIYYKNVNRAPM